MASIPRIAADRNKTPYGREGEFFWCKVVGVEDWCAHQVCDKSACGSKETTVLDHAVWGGKTTVTRLPFPQVVDVAVIPQSNPKRTGVKTDANTSKH